MIEIFIGQGIVGIIVAIASAIILSRVGAVHKLVDGRATEADRRLAAQGGQIDLLLAQLKAQGLLLTASEKASKHSE